MSTGPVATASVKIVPDLTGFQALLQTEVNKAVAGIKVPAIKANVAASALASTAAGSTARANTGASAAVAAKGVNDLTKSSQALRGSLIGLSRVTPVTVFGLGVYGTAAIAAGYAIKGAIRSTADFEHQLNVFQATTGATVVEMEAIQAEAKALGADLSLPATSAGDAALAMTELAKAGLTVQDTLAGAKGVLQLAAAAQIDVGSAAQFVATELNAFALSGENATHVADLLAGASIAAQGDIRDFGTAFQQVSAVAHGANVSLETTTGLLTELARAGLRGADAGTSVRTFLLRLTPTTKQAAQYQEALNIKLDQTKTIGEQLPSLIGQYQRALSALTPIQQQQALTQIFGQDAIRAATILINGGTDALRENTDAANQNGAAARLAAANAKGLSGAFNGLKSNLDTLGITLGDFVKGPLTDFVVVLSQVVSLTDKAATAFANLKTPDFLGGKTTDKAGNEALKALFVYPLINEQFFEKKRTAFQKATDEINADRKARNEAVAAADISAAKGIHDEGSGASRAAVDQAAGIHDESGRTSVGPSLTNKEKAAAQARFRALQASKEKPKAIDVSPPARLEDAKLQAQLNDNLQAELKADQAIENYLRKRLKLAENKPKVYHAILEALTQAHAATQSVLGQITSENKQAQQERQTAVTDAISLQRTRLENAADLADHQGEAERKLIAFYLAESKDLRLEASARLAYEAAYNAEIKAQQAAVVATAKAEIDLRNARLDLAIQRADLTPEQADNRRAINNKIKALNRDIKGIKAIKNKTIEQRQELVALQSQVTGLKLQLQGLSGQANGGFTLGELFQEAVNEFTTFGSNIRAPGSNSPLSGQDARGALGAQILSGIPAAQLTEAQKQTLLLTSIDAKLNAQPQLRHTSGAPAGARGGLGAYERSQQAATNGYGAG